VLADLRHEFLFVHEFGKGDIPNGINLSFIAWPILDVV